MLRLVTRLCLFWLAMGTLLTVGCGDRADDYIVLAPLPPALPAIADAGIPVPDGAKRCLTADACDDGVSCTEDLCVAQTYCWSRPVAARCSDGVFCNGTESCVPKVGCVQGTSPSCGDGNVCTTDSCSEELKACVHRPRDFDQDGEADWHCPQGTDCDDQDPNVRQSAAERCGDGRDNDCDGVTDESACGAVEFDDCSDPLSMAAPGTFVVGLAGTTRDYALSCVTGNSRDAVLTFELDRPRDVHITASGLLGNGVTEAASVALRAACEPGAEDIACATGFPAHVRRRALAAGRYFVLVDSAFAKEVVVSLDLQEPTVAPTNTSCASPWLLQDGQRIVGDFVGTGDDLLAPCGLQPAEGFVTAQSDLVYRITLDQPQDVALLALTPTDDPLVLSVRGDCSDPESTLLCIRDRAPSALLRSLDPGTYFVVLESPSYLEADFELEMRLAAPTPQPPGDTCDSAIPSLPIGEVTLVSLANNQSWIDTTCDQYSPDAAYNFVLPQAADVLVTTHAFGLPIATAVQSTCGQSDGELICAADLGGKRRLRNLDAGQYTLVVESQGAREVTVRVELLPRTQPVEVQGNERCENAFVVSQEGGAFLGDTAGAANSYAACSNSRSGDVAYRLELTQQSRVQARLEASFDTLLYRFEDSGAGASACDGEFAACNDDAADAVGRESALDEVLEAGVHYYVVDGYSVGNEGPYVLTFEVN